MKKVLISALVVFLAFAVVRIGTSSYENIRLDDGVQEVLESKRITAEEAERICYAVMGEQDEATGFPFSFGVTNLVKQEGKEYYAIRASWLVNNSHMSYIGDFFVSVDGKELYAGSVQDDKVLLQELIWCFPNKMH